MMKKIRRLFSQVFAPKASATRQGARANFGENTCACSLEALRDGCLLTIELITSKLQELEEELDKIPGLEAPESERWPDKDKRAIELLGIWQHLFAAAQQWSVMTPDELGEMLERDKDICADLGIDASGGLIREGEKKVIDPDIVWP